MGGARLRLRRCRRCLHPLRQELVLLLCLELLLLLRLALCLLLRLEALLLSLELLLLLRRDTLQLLLPFLLLRLLRLLRWLRLLLRLLPLPLAVLVLFGRLEEHSILLPPHLLPLRLQLYLQLRLLLRPLPLAVEALLVQVLDHCLRSSPLPIVVEALLVDELISEESIVQRLNGEWAPPLPPGVGSKCGWTCAALGALCVCPCAADTPRRCRQPRDPHAPLGCRARRHRPRGMPVRSESEAAPVGRIREVECSRERCSALRRRCAT
jgi:hypothetical protein